MTDEQKKEFELLDSKIDKFIEDNVRCETCCFFVNDLFSPRCDGPEGQIEELGSLDSCCENHTFLDKKKEKEIDDLSSRLAEIIIKDFEENKDNYFTHKRN